MSNTDTDVHTRWMIRRDMPEVMEIEKNAGQWSKEDFLSVFWSRNTIGKVAVRGDDVVGFSVHKFSKRAMTVLKLEGEVDALLVEMMGELRMGCRTRTRIVINVNESHLQRQKFLREYGFRAEEVLRGYCDDGRDAYRMVYRLEDQ